MVGPVVFLAAAVVAQAGQVQQTGWKSFSPTFGEFRVLMPATPTEAEHSLGTKDAPITYHTYTAVKGTETFVAAYQDYPAASMKNGPKRLLDSARDGMVANMRGKLVARREITQGGFPGREFTFEAPDPRGGGQQVYKVRLYLVKRRLFQAMVIAPKTVMAAGNGDPRIFLNSFKLKARAEIEEDQSEPEEEPSEPAAEEPAPKAKEEPAPQASTAARARAGRARTSGATPKSLARRTTPAASTASKSAARPAAGTSSPSSLKTFTVPEGEFTVDLPGTPEAHGEQTQQLQEGTLTGRSYQLKMKDAAYQVAAHRLPKAPTGLGARAATLAGHRDGVARSLNGNVLQQRYLWLGPFLGLDYAVEFDPPDGSGKKRIHYRVFLVNDRLDTVGIQADSNRPESAEDTHVLDSVRLLAHPQDTVQTEPPKPAWKTCTVAEQGFSVAFPGDPLIKPQPPANTPGGAVERTDFLAENGLNNYALRAVTLPQPIPESSVDRGLDRLKDAVIKDFHGTYQDRGTKPITLKGIPGKELNGEVVDPSSGVRLWLRTRLFIHGKHMYAVGISRLTNDHFEEEGAKFFDSFAILGS